MSMLPVLDLTNEISVLQICEIKRYTPGNYRKNNFEMNITLSLYFYIIWYPWDLK